VTDVAKWFCSGCQRWKAPICLKLVKPRKQCDSCVAKANARRVNAPTGVMRFKQQHLTNAQAKSAKKQYLAGVIPPFAKT
jgi:hypothetical protein